jgi:hypothetical protein
VTQKPGQMRWRAVKYRSGWSKSKMERQISARKWPHVVGGHRRDPGLADEQRGYSQHSSGRSSFEVIDHGAFEHGPVRGRRDQQLGRQRQGAGAATIGDASACACISLLGVSTGGSGCGLSMTSAWADHRARP